MCPKADVEYERVRAAETLLDTLGFVHRPRLKEHGLEVRKEHVKYSIMAVRMQRTLWRVYLMAEKFSPPSSAQWLGVPFHERKEYADLEELAEAVASALESIELHHAGVVKCLSR